MPNSTVLSLFQTTMQGMGVAVSGQPATVISNTNQDVVQTLALVNGAGGELAREFYWQYGQVQYNFEATYFAYTGNSTINSTSLTSMSSITSLDTTFMVEGLGVPQDTFINAAPSGTTVVMNREATSTNTTATYTFSKVRFAVPTGFDRMIDDTHWDKDAHWKMYGPMNPQQQAWIRSGYIARGPRIRHWMQEGYFQIWPPLGEDENLAFTYQSKYWILATAATAISKELYTVDTDTCIFPDPLMRAMIRLKYCEAKGLDTGTVTDPGTAVYNYQRQLEIAKANDAGSPVLAMNPTPSSQLIGFNNIPDSGFGT